MTSNSKTAMRYVLYRKHTTPGAVAERLFLDYTMLFFLYDHLNCLIKTRLRCSYVEVIATKIIRSSRTDFKLRVNESFPFYVDLSFIYHRQDMIKRVTRRASYKNKNYLPFAGTWGPPRFCLVGQVRVAHHFSFVSCLSSFCVLCPMLPVSLDGIFLVARSVFSYEHVVPLRHIILNHVNICLYYTNTLIWIAMLQLTKQQFASSQVASLGYIISTPSQHVLDFTPYIVILHAQQRNRQCQFYSFWIDPAVGGAHSVMHSRKHANYFTIDAVHFEMRDTKKNNYVRTRTTTHQI